MINEPAGCGWWDGSWNPVGGCKPVGPGCFNCYAAKLAATRHTVQRGQLYEGTTAWVNERPVFNGKLTVLPPEHPEWVSPLTWQGAECPLLGPGQPSLIFVVDMGDLFEEKRPKGIIDQVVGTLVYSRHIGLLLTRRARQMAEYFSAPQHEKTQERQKAKLWLGFSAENQRWFDRFWPHIRPLAKSGFITFVSIAPMLGPVILPPDFLELGERVWVIASGEQGCGCGASDMDPDWARALRDQCEEAGVPFFMLQMTRKAEIPDDLLIRQFPRPASIYGTK
jgi:protein gp37